MEDTKTTLWSSGYIQTSVGRLYYRDYHPDGSYGCVVCIHGNSIDGSIFNKFIHDGGMNPLMRYIVFDTIGHGQSSDAVVSSSKQESDIYTFTGMAKVFLEACEKLHIDTYSILGLSKGGHEAIAMLHLNKYARIECVIITGTPPICGNDMNEAFINSPAMAYCGHGEQLTAEQAAVFIRAYGLNEIDIQKFIPVAMRTHGQARKCMVEAIREGKGLNEIELLQRTSTPVLIVGGTDDAFINYEYVKSQQFSSTVEVRVVDGEGHSFLHCNPVLFGSIVSEFYQRRVVCTG